MENKIKIVLIFESVDFWRDKLVTTLFYDNLGMESFWKCSSLIKLKALDVNFSKPIKLKTILNVFPARIGY